MDQNEHPAASRRGFLRSGGIAALFGATAAATVASAAAQTEMVSPELRDLIEKHRAAAEILRKAEVRYVEAEAKCEEGTPKHVPFSSWCRDAARHNEPAPLLHPYGLKNCLARAEWEIRVRAPVDDALKALPIARQKQITAALKGARKDAERIIRATFEQAAEARRASGVDEAAERVEWAKDDENRALTDLVRFKCASVADVNARAEYLAGLDGVSPKAGAAALAAPLAVGEA